MVEDGSPNNQRGDGRRRKPSLFTALRQPIIPPVPSNGVSGRYQRSSALFSIRTSRWTGRSALLLKKNEVVHIRPSKPTSYLQTRKRNLRVRLAGSVSPRPSRCSWAHSSAILLRTPIRDEAALCMMVEMVLWRRMKLIAAVGPDSIGAEFAVDRVIVGDGEYDPRRFLLTTAHETTIDALSYIEACTGRRRIVEVWL